MAMLGTVVMEDTVLQYQAVESHTKVRYTVTDTLQGVSASVACDMRSFFVALSIAMHPEGDAVSDEDYAEAKSAMPQRSDVNGPFPTEEAIDDALDALRWVP